MPSVVSANSYIDALRQYHAEAVRRHCRWFSYVPAWHSHYLKWSKRFDNDTECAGAIAEACVRELLCRGVEAVVPSPEPGPDFECHSNGQRFYVEVSTVEIEAATRRTSLTPEPEGNGAQAYGKLYQPMFFKCRDKEKQCGFRADAPTLLALGTLHFQAGALCFGRADAEVALTGIPRITQWLNSTTGDAVGDIHETTSLDSAVFLRPARIIGSEQRIVLERRSISGLVLCGFGAISGSYDRPKFPWRAFGSLHPDPNIKFDPALLPNVPFARLAHGWQSGNLSVDWPPGFDPKDRQ